MCGQSKTFIINFQQGDYLSGKLLYDAMKTERVSPDITTYANMLTMNSRLAVVLRLLTTISVFKIAPKVGMKSFQKWTRR